MNDTLKNILSLTIIIAVATMALSLTYQLTKDQIEENKREEFVKTVKLAFPYFGHTTTHSIFVDGEKKGDYYKVYDKKGEWVGYVIVEEVDGYQSKIQILIGYTKKKEIKSVHILEQYETAGIGTRIEERTFLEQFKGKEKDQLYPSRREGEIDGISGATVSSEAVIEGVRKSFETMDQEIHKENN